MLPEDFFFKLDALRLLLRPFWDRSRAVIALHGSGSIASILFWPCLLTPTSGSNKGYGIAIDTDLRSKLSPPLGCSTVTHHIM